MSKHDNRRFFRAAWLASAILTLSMLLPAKRARAGGGPAADFDTLIDLITTTIEPTSWDDVGGPGNISDVPANLSLIVSQTSVQGEHEQIADLLERLRKLQDLQITIEVRFITLQDDFFERIGIDFDFNIDDDVEDPGEAGGDADVAGGIGTVLWIDDVIRRENEGPFGEDPPINWPGPTNETPDNWGGFDPASASTLGFAILSDIEVFFLLQAAQGDDRSNILQAPKVTLFNGQVGSLTTREPLQEAVVTPGATKFDAESRLRLSPMGVGAWIVDLAKGLLVKLWSYCATASDQPARPWALAKVQAAVPAAQNGDPARQLAHYALSLRTANEEVKTAAIEQLPLALQPALRGALEDAQAGRRLSLPQPHRYDRQPVVVAVLDTGTDIRHPALAGQLWRNPGEIPGNGVDDDDNGYVDDVFGYNTGGNNADIRDTIGHGTFVAGLIVARGEAGDLARGIAPTAEVMTLKVANGRGGTDIARVGLAIRYAVENGARIINLSAEGEPLEDIDRQVLQWAQRQGVLIVAAAGSRGLPTGKVVPASIPGVLTVAATDRDDRRPSYSGWGTHVDLSAPGVDLLGLRARDTDFVFTLTAGKGAARGASVVSERVYRASGTSFAAPLVAGAAARLWAAEPGLTAEQVRRKLLMSADDLGKPGWDKQTGFGRLNLARAMAADKSHFLGTRVDRLELSRRRGQPVLILRGSAQGTHFARRRVEIAFGSEPAEADWTTVLRSVRPVADAGGSLGTLRGRLFDRAGMWSVRSVVEDRRGTRREARTQFRLK